MQSVVQIIAPHAVHPSASELRRAHQPRVIQMTFCDQQQAPTPLGLPAPDASGQFFQKMQRRTVKHGLNGVQTQSIQLELL